MLAIKWVRIYVFSFSIEFPGKKPAMKSALDPRSLYLFSPSGAIDSAAELRRAAQNLRRAGFSVEIDAAALARQQRFAGSDAERLAAFERAAQSRCAIVMATRGGYGLTRLLPQLDFRALTKSGKKWAGHSDFTAFSLALLAESGAPSFSAPMALPDFSGTGDAQTRNHFVRALLGTEGSVRWRSANSPAQLGEKRSIRGTLWGGNLTVLASLAGTRFMPAIEGGLLFLEDVNEPFYRIERCLLQLHQAGILRRQRALLLGRFTNVPRSARDRGFNLRVIEDYLRSLIRAPVLSGLPIGHVARKLTLPIGQTAQLEISQGYAQVLWRAGSV